MRRSAPFRMALVILPAVLAAAAPGNNRLGSASFSFPALIAAMCPQFPSLNAPGVLCEDFDTDRNEALGFQWSRLPVGVDPNDPLRAIGDPLDDVLGYTQGTGAIPGGTGSVTCAGQTNQPGCQAPVAEENDWHLHSPLEGPGQGYDPAGRPGIGAPDGGKAHSGIRSMHWGRHTDPAAALGDATRFRQVAAFVLDPPVNLGPASTMEFWQIMKGLTIYNDLFPPYTMTFGGGQIDISLAGDDGRFGRWQRLTPAFNGYDGIVQRITSICQFDPGDDSMPPADETMCGDSPLWSIMGDVNGTDTTCTTDSDGNDYRQTDCGRISSCSGGPGCAENGSIGAGVWVRSAFDLSPFAGQRARLRWVTSMGGGWSFGVSRSALEPEPGGSAYQYFEADDGWWIDDVLLTDLRVAACTDLDRDAVRTCEDDCDDGNPDIWATPGEVPVLSVAADTETLGWTQPASPGGTAMRYDLLRSPHGGNFMDDTSCVASDWAGIAIGDPDVPSVGGIHYYLVRAVNSCPTGDGPLGSDSGGAAIVGRDCPP